MAEPPPWRTDVAVLVIHPTEADVWQPEADEPVLRFEHDDYLWFPDVEPVLGTLRERWDLDAIVLRCLAVEEDREARHLRETFLVQPRPGTLPHHGRWLPVPALPDDPGQAVMREIEDSPSRTRRPWSRRGWFEDATSWAEAALCAAGRPPTGPVVQLRTWGLSTVLRFETEQGNVFFKAAAHGGDTDGRGFLFANEAALLDGLAGHFPEHLPRPIATDPERVWMLLPDAGTALADSDDVDAWEEAIRLHARHQRAFVGEEAELTRLGCLDRRLVRLAAHLDGLMTDDAARALLKPGDHDRLLASAPAIHALIDEATGLGIPETLVHGDLHAGNVGLREGRIVFFDWTDACIGHPFLDVVTFLDGELVPDAVAPGRERLRGAYLDEWHGVADRAALERAVEIVPLLGMLHQAISYQHMLPVLDEPDRTAMSRGLSGWLHELLDRLAEPV